MEKTEKSAGRMKVGQIGAFCGEKNKKGGGRKGNCNNLRGKGQKGGWQVIVRWAAWNGKGG